MTAIRTHTTAGFADPTLSAQRNFRAAMNAMARPGSIEPLSLELSAPAPLTDELAAIALTLADHEAPIWLDSRLAASREVVDYLRFHTGARIVAEPAEASFAFVVDPEAMPPLSDFALGTDDYPDRSTTIVIAVDELAADGGFTLSGPGIAREARLRVEPLPADFEAEIDANGRIFPRGVDLVFVGDGHVAALPRTARLKGA